MATVSSFPILLPTFDTVKFSEKQNNIDSLLRHLQIVAITIPFKILSILYFGRLFEVKLQKIHDKRSLNTVKQPERNSPLLDKFSLSAP